MRFSLILLIAPAAMALATMGEPMTGNFDELETRSLETRSLEPRACKKTGCKCDTTRNRSPQGQFCGGCKWSDGAYVITKKRKISHVYECNKSGGCCDYGFAKDCEGDKLGGRCG